MTRDFPVAATPVLQDKFLNLSVSFPKGVLAWHDVVYQAVDGYRANASSLMAR